VTRLSRALLAATLLACSRTETAPTSNRTAPLTAAPVRFAVIGDFGADTPDEAAVAALVKSWKPDFVVTTGDDNYPRGEAATIDANIGKYYAEYIGNYKGAYGPGSKLNRFWPSPGNHDWMSGLGPYIEYFTLPGNERYYDVSLGLVHLYAIDSDASEPDGTGATSTQAAWLKEHLASSKACFDIVYFHHPPYSTSRHGSSPEMRWPFHQWGAEAVMSGHDHVYERSTVDGIPYFVNGVGGAPRYDFPAPPAPETQFRYNAGFGAMLVTATQSGITYDFFTVDGTKRDTLTTPARCSPQ
jgi:tartrate-resistant acid phosphatase type 5